jgi:DnaJ domain
MSNGIGDPYAVLGVAPDASDADLRAAYRAALRRAHPDSGGSGDGISSITAAWQLVGDPRRRAAFDRQAQASPDRGESPQPAAAPQPAPSPARFPWRFMTVMAAIGIGVVVVGNAMRSPAEPLRPVLLVEPGACVRYAANGDAGAVPCDGPHDGVVQRLIGFDESCVFPEEQHRDEQGRGFACTLAAAP